MKRRLPVRLICLVVAFTVLMGTLTVAAINGSPYETLKDAIFNTLIEDNVTVRAEFTIRVNGEVNESALVYGVFGNESILSIEYDYDEWGESTTQFSFQNADMSLQSNLVMANGEEWYSVRISNDIERERFTGFTISELTAEDRDSNMFRFAELAVDMVVGNLRNNISIANQGNGIRRISGAVTGSQLPEIIRVGIDWAIEDSHRRSVHFTPRDDDRIFDIPIQSLAIDRIYGIADIDGDDHLTYINAGAVITIVDMFGTESVIEAEMTIHFTDRGTSNPQSPIPEVETLFTREFIEYHFDNISRTIHFQLDANGNIDQDSISDRWPSRSN